MVFVFPNGGVMGAEGDYRAYVSMARQILSEGYYTFRFSPEGLGYSDGDIPDCAQKSLFNKIENGLFVNDIKAAVKFVSSLDFFSSIILVGVCGGAISSFIATAEIKEVERVVPIGIPVILDDPAMDYDQRILSLDKQYITRQYLDKIFSFSSWIKLLSGKSNIRHLFGILKSLFQKKHSYLSNEKTNNGDQDKSKFTPNPLFFEVALKLFKNRKKILFVFGDTDGFWWEFQTLFLNKFYLNDENRPFDIYISKNSNHMLSLTEMQIDVTNEILSWVKR